MQGLIDKKMVVAKTRPSQEVAKTRPRSKFFKPKNKDQRTAHESARASRMTKTRPESYNFVNFKLQKQSLTNYLSIS